jgi:hypothetical protein
VNDNHSAEHDHEYYYRLYKTSQNRLLLPANLARYSLWVNY